VQRHAEIAVHHPAPTNTIARDWLSGYGKPNPSTAFLITDIFTSMGLRHVDVRAKRDYIKTPQQIGPAIGNTRTRRQSTRNLPRQPYSQSEFPLGTHYLRLERALPNARRLRLSGCFRGSRFTSEQAVAFPTIGRLVAKSHTVI